MTEERQEYPIATLEGEALADVTPAQALVEMGESVGDLARLGDKPAQLPIRSWVKVACVQGIQNWLIDNQSTNVTEACRVTGWKRWTYERALRDPIVIDYLLQRRYATFDLGARMVEDEWPDVVRAQLAIAQDTENGQAATRAATWLAEQLRIHDERAKVVAREAEQQEGSDRLGRIAARFGAELKEKTTVTRTVKLPAEP